MFNKTRVQKYALQSSGAILNNKDFACLFGNGCDAICAAFCEDFKDKRTQRGDAFSDAQGSESREGALVAARVHGYWVQTKCLLTYLLLSFQSLCL
jgi:hypothetical protein